MEGFPTTIDHLLFLDNTAKEKFGDQFSWSYVEAGNKEFDIVTAAMLLGDNIRIGLEENLYLSKVVLAKSNS